MKPILSCLFLMLLLHNKVFAQWKASDVTKVTYTSIFGGMFSCSNTIWLEIVPNGNIRMYHDSYAKDTIIETLQKQNGTMKVKDFQQLVGPLACYYSDKLSGNVYAELVGKIIQMQSDTTAKKNPCCCDIPYQMVTVYFKNDSKKFMQCDGIAKPKVSDLIGYLNNVAYRPGYKRAPARFKFERD